jgi:type III secretion protein V
MSSVRDILNSRPRTGRFAIADAVLAALVIAVVGLMIVPLPTWLLDLLIAANLALAVTILLVTLYVTDTLNIASFPSLLLITTLIRLALNVSSTRLILLQADAGKMIEAFGGFVVRGNYVVGAVIFLILSIIQFVVIAKGSERVAEVGARFTLDAMPGKQMAIDAELRAGSIDGNEAKQRRRHLARESQFYGAMDGAMKFVKGDVIASFLITIINILGGLTIGMLQRGMDATSALTKYGLLTIGDGLVSQIPALVLSTAAGILVTRVASEEQDTALGKEMGDQLLRSPKAIAVAGGFVLALGIVPGLPTLPLLAIGGALLLISRLPGRRASEPEPVAGVTTPVERDVRSNAPRFIPVILPWGLECSADLETLFDDHSRGDTLLRPGLRSVTTAAREILFRELGVPLPACPLQIGRDLPPRTVVISLFEIPTRVIVVPESVADDLLAQFVLEDVMQTLRRRASEFLGISETQGLLDRLEQIAPATVRQVVPKPVSITLLADILRRLLEEGISVRDLKGVLEALSHVAQADKDPLNLTEYVRSQFKRGLTFELTGGGNEVRVLLLAGEIEETVRDAISRTAAGSFLTLAPGPAREIVDAVKRAVEAQKTSVTNPPVLLTQPDIRRFVRKLLELDHPALRVMSYSELLPELRITPVGTVTIRPPHAPPG